MYLIIKKNKKEMSKLNRNNYILSWEFKVIDRFLFFVEGERLVDFLLSGLYC